MNNIPSSVMDKVAIYPYYYMCELPYFNELRNILKEKFNVSLTYLGPPKMRKNYYGSLLRHVETTKKDREVIIVYDDALDSLGHKFGPQSLECLQYLRSLDKILKEVYSKLSNIHIANFAFLVFSDHSQCGLKCKIDLLSELYQKGLKWGVNYVCFIDATLALFWTKNDYEKRKILKILHKFQFGTVIDQGLRNKHHIEFDDDRFGEIIYILKPGFTFFPNFYSPFSPMKGLHGYLPEEEVQKSFLISNTQFSFTPTHVKHIKQLFLELSSFGY